MAVTSVRRVRAAAWLALTFVGVRAHAASTPRPTAHALARLRVLGELRGKVVDSSGRPATGFELVARLPGGRVARAPVELVDGRTTDVELVFD